MHTTRRDLIRKAAYMAPVILTLPAIPSFAQTGSGGGGSGSGGGLDCGGGEGNHNQIFCFYEQPDGTIDVGGFPGRPGPEPTDPNALFCSCDS